MQTDGTKHDLENTRRDLIVLRQTHRPNRPSLLAPSLGLLGQSTTVRCWRHEQTSTS